MKVIRNHWPLMLAVLVLWATLAVLLRQSIALNDGQLIYGLDDPYIHMAMAKNLAEYGVWGITKYGFTSSGSSLSWPLLLALDYKIFGPNEISPLILNILFATGLLWLVYALWRRYGLGSWMTAVGLLAIIFFGPLPSVIFCGQEHIMHAFLAIAVVSLAASSLAGKGASRGLFLLLPLFLATRYESIAILLIICALFILRGRLKQSALLGMVGMLPLVVYGVISTSKGWSFLPNSVLLKAAPDLNNGFGQYLVSVLQQIYQNPDVIIFALWGSIAFYLQHTRQKTFWNEHSVMLVILVPAIMMHLVFGQTGWLCRYETYLAILGLFAIIPALAKYVPPPKGEGARLRLASLGVVIFISCLPLLSRSAVAFSQIPTATQNIYGQQYQMARFLSEFYQGQSVAVNDVGAVNYYADLKCLDVWGLAQREVLQQKENRTYSGETVADLANENGVKIAILYDDWFSKCGGVSKQWVRVGRWMIPNNIVCGGDIISFYAVDPSEAGQLEDHLWAFAHNLPSQVAYEIDSVAGR